MYQYNSTVHSQKQLNVPTDKLKHYDIWQTPHGDISEWRCRLIIKSESFIEMDILIRFMETNQTFINSDAVSWV